MYRHRIVSVIDLINDRSLEFNHLIIVLRNPCISVEDFSKSTPAKTPTNAFIDIEHFEDSVCTGLKVITLHTLVKIPSSSIVTLGGGGGGGFGGGRGGAARLSGGTVLSQDIYSYATDAEVCLLFLVVFPGEGADRTELRNTDQDILVTSVAAGCHNTVDIISTVRARIVDTSIDLKHLLS
ncbi:hypothetical protein BGAL_0025g00330 [Botrytis galanthina]|uniref:Uncharacterized protein n=1 Tax=Botrytis galanthina TaxID=278940 RepID=A0A4S8R8V8_9HELO|nr:hypothetical protein BGAL_0025g00330 [Botrytis galanthina]